MGQIIRDYCRNKKSVSHTNRPISTAVFMLRCKELGLSMDELDELDAGMIYDMLAEKINDDYEWDVMASESDIDKF